VNKLLIKSTEKKKTNRPIPLLSFLFFTISERDKNYQIDCTLFLNLFKNFGKFPKKTSASCRNYRDSACGYGSAPSSTSGTDNVNRHKKKSSRERGETSCPNPKGSEFKR
jgi:hypothetical protein